VIAAATSNDTAGAGLPTPPGGARMLFGARFELAQRYAQLLATSGVERGLLGPREVPRLWERHLLNCAVLAELVPPGARVVDVGSGAGLPGLPMVLCRPDLTVDLVEPMLRRSTFLAEVVHELALGDTVRVVRGRADDPGTVQSVGGAEWVVARAVAPLDRLGQWCLPLLAPGGTLLALKGRTVADEVARYRPALARLGAASVDVRLVGSAESARAQVAVVRRIGVS
jgi:16S rRNA (guanine527-N7)-methyltransferase